MKENLFMNWQVKKEFFSQAINRKKEDIADLKLSSEIKFVGSNKKYNKKKSCNDCGRQLDSSDALYNVFMGGPYCDDCVECDEEMSGHKWENS